MRTFLGKLFVFYEKVKENCKSQYNTRILFHGTDPGKGFIGGGVKFKNPDKIYVGKDTYINGGMLFAEDGTITIGKNCLISYNVHLRTDVHNYIRKDLLINEQGNKSNDIIVEDDVWIGYGAQIMSGVKIAKGCVIGAGAVVTHNTEEYGVYVGVPAKRIKSRR